MRKTKLLLLVCFLVIFILGCKKKCQEIEGSEPIEYSSLTFILLKTSNQAPAIPTFYHPDSVKFFDANMNMLNVSYENNSGSYHYKFLNFYNSSSMNSEISTNYFIKINGQISDTIKLVQRSFKNECDKNTLDYLKLYVNDSLNFSNDNDSESAFYYTIELYIH